MNGIHKLSSVCLAILSSIILVGCTLTMDEWVETEETKGYDDVETVENDFYKFSYQYKENTRSLTTDIQKYIAQVEADSIIWFTDNIPQGWLPQVGGGVVANCCQNFPMGLLAKVETIDHLSGMYRVQTTSAKIEELYDEFDLDLNTDVYTAPVEDVEEESGEEGSEAKAAGSPMQERIEYAETRSSGNSNQVVIRDWTMFHDIEQGKKQHQTTATRADMNDVWDQDANNTAEKTTDILIYDASPALSSIVKTLTSGYVNNAEMKLISTTKTKMHKVVQLKKKREYTETTTTSGIKGSVKIGHDLSGKNVKDTKQQQELLEELLKQRNEKKLKGYAKGIGEKEGLGDLELTAEIPIAGAPLGILLRFKPVLEFNIGLYGQGEITVWTSSEYVETEVIDGKKIKDNKQNKTPPSNEVALSLFGEFSAKGGFELFAGVGKKLGAKPTDKAVGIGAFLELTMNFDLTLGGEMDMVTKSISLSSQNALSITGKGKFGGKILTGGIFGDVTFLAKEFKWWDGVTLGFNPTIKYSSTERMVNKDEYVEQQLSWYFSNAGMVWSNTWAMYNKPVLGVFEKGASDTSKPVAVLRSTSIDQKVDKNNLMKLNKLYTFTFKNTKKKDYDIIPGVTMSSMDTPDRVTWYPDYKRTMKAIVRPSIEYDLVKNYDENAKFTGYYDYVFQTQGKTNSDGQCLYRVALPFTLHDAAYISEYWDDWGIRYEAHADKVNDVSGVIPAWNEYSQWISLKNSIIKSGKFVVSTTFWARPYEVQPVWCDAYLWYKPKGSTTTIKIRSEDSWPYCYQLYKTQTNTSGDKLLNVKNYLYSDMDEIVPIEGFEEKKVDFTK